LELGSETGGYEVCVEELKRTEDARAGTIVHRFHEDAVAVVIVDDKNVVVAGTGCNDETTRLVAMDLASCRCTDSREAMVGAIVVWVAGGKGRNSGVVRILGVRDW
jgi:hypothetical protein